MDIKIRIILNMPTTVNQLSDSYNLPFAKRVKWNERISTQDEGVYIVSLSEESGKNNGIQKNPPISRDIIRKWIKKVDGFEIDKIKTFDTGKVIERLSQFWLPDENILYIGKAPRRSSGKGIGNRIREYYKTKYGEKRPHAGGHWLKSLIILDELFVYYTTCENPGEIEEGMLRFFCNNVSDSTRSILRDKELLLPFANLQLRRGQVKNHGLGKMKK